MLTHLASPILAQEATSSAIPTVSIEQTTGTDEASLQAPAPTLPSSTPTITPSPAPLLLTPTTTPIVIQKTAQKPEISALDKSETLSAKIKKKSRLIPLLKRNFQPREDIDLEVKSTYNENVNISVKDEDGNNLPVIIEQKHIGEDTKIKIIPPPRFKPGIYKLKIIDSQGNSFEQDFTWGVLAINVNKSIYLPQETVNFAITVLNESGSMVCNANVGLEIVSPTGIRTTFGTENKSITVNPDCFLRDKHPRPDYETSMPLGDEIGVYQMNLFAETKNGRYEISDAFEVRESIPFDVERIATTRVFPLNNYEVKMQITAFQDFEGTIVETVPEIFKILPISNARSYDTVATEEAKLEKDQEISAQTSQLSFPFSGGYTKTQGFGDVPDNLLLRLRYRWLGSEKHDGIDYAMPKGTPIQTIDDGEVIQSGWGDYGITVAIQHTWGKTYYGHLSETTFEIGKRVKRADIIGYSGNTGLSTGPHLHFALRPNDADFENGFNGKVDPIAFIQKNNTNLALKNPQDSLNTTGSKNILGTSSSIFQSKKIKWNLSLKSGETITIGYIFDPPEISPQFYLLGPLTFQEPTTILSFRTESQRSEKSSDSARLSLSNQNEDDRTISVPRSTPVLPDENTASDSVSTSSSAQFNNTKIEQFNNLTNQQSNKLAIEQSSNFRIIFSEARQWQIAADPDVPIDDTTAIQVERTKGEPHLVFISDQVGYAFYTDSGATCSYSKTTNGGASWGVSVDLEDLGGVDTCRNVTVWYDQWTPGDLTGTKIHIAMLDALTDDVYYDILDTSNDTDITEISVLADSTALGDFEYTSITKSTTGVLYMALSDDTAGGSDVESCSTTCTTSTNWSNVGTIPLDAALDTIRLVPLSGGNIMLIRDDLSLDDIESNIWNGSSWGGWTDIDANAPEGGADDIDTISAAVRRYDNNIYLTYLANAGGAGTADVRTAVYDGLSWSVKTEVVSDQNTATDASIAIDEESGTVYVAYLRGSSATVQNLYYKSSTDNMASWGSETQLNASYIDGNNDHPMLNLVDSERIYFTYWNETNADLMGNTVVNLTPPTLEELMRHGDWFSKTGIRKTFSW